MKKVANIILLTLLLLITGAAPVLAEKELPAELQKLTDEAVEEFVGDAEPSDDLTKMCIKLY